VLLTQDLHCLLQKGNKKVRQWKEGAGLPDFSLMHDTKTGKNYQMNTKYTK
jgi:hypothetical protein